MKNLMAFAALLTVAPLVASAETTARAYSTAEVEKLAKAEKKPKAPDGKPPAYSTNGWKLVWSDEFEKPGHPDSAVWGYENGFVRNHEPQFYTTNRLENACVKDGVLVVTARAEKWANPLWKDRRLGGWSREREFADFTSASVTTAGKKTFLYGRLEIRAQMPKGVGTWPAIWTLGENIGFKGDKQVNWPACGEIDIVECWGIHSNRVAACLHCSKDGRPQKAEHKVAGGGDLGGPTVRPYDGFHTYTLDWDKDHMNMYYDGRRYGGGDLSRADWPDGGNPFRMPQYLILNLALGGYDNPTRDPSVFPAEMKIDWVRYYQRQ